MQKSFFAYPVNPADIAQTIRAAIKKHNDSNNVITLEPWEINDISGVPITSTIFEKIGTVDYVAADITYLNENVAFEIGFAIGQNKRCLLFGNNAFEGDEELTSSVGVFDTLGYEEYSNSDDLYRLLIARTEFDPIPITSQRNHKAPVYIIEPPRRTDAFGILVSRVKKARWMYRSFNPSEDVRLAAMDAIRHASQSAGVITPLLSNGVVGQREHNMRSMFVAGLSLALEIPTLIIHPTNHTPPMDVRDLTKKYKHPEDIADIIQEFSLDITEYTQRDETLVVDTGNILGNLRVGDPTAENEMTTLSDYYLITDEFQRALRGEVNLVVGRKGSGKTALFVQLRNTKRANRQNIVIDLKPEGYQLIKLKERVLDHLTEGARQHLITAFWEYVLLLEITYKLLEKDRRVHLHDHRLTEQYTKLAELYGTSNFAGEGDFSERLVKLSDHLSDDYGATFSIEENRNITSEQITEILYKHDIKELFVSLSAYLKLKKEVWLLFDNIDKSWNVEGVTDTDIFVLRCLINASRKLERDLRRGDIKFRSIVFVRDDVYTLLMQGSADYGKEMRATLDWSDKDLLSQVLIKRLTYSLEGETVGNLPLVWNRIGVSHYFSETSIEYMINRSLMRPRNLLKIFRYSLGHAINLGHERIEVADITGGLRTYSLDLVMEIDRELTDVFPGARRLIYEFLEENARFSHEELILLINIFGREESEAEQVISLLLYYGIIGVQRSNEDDPLYIYDVNYDIEFLRVRIRKWGVSTWCVVIPALWIALKVEDDAPQLAI